MLGWEPEFSFSIEPGGAILKTDTYLQVSYQVRRLSESFWNSRGAGFHFLVSVLGADPRLGHAAELSYCSGQSQALGKLKSVVSRFHGVLVNRMAPRISAVHVSRN
jgi:hypothetical protein